jgi:hypothetical protein
VIRFPCRSGGVFPRTGSLQFIDGERVVEAVARPLGRGPDGAPDHGRRYRPPGRRSERHPLPPGLDARSIPAVKFRIPDLMQIASRVMEQVNSHNPDAVFVDGAGIGWSVHDRLNQLGCPNLAGIDFGGKADRTDTSDAAARYTNKRAEMWGFMKEWCKVGSLPDDTELLADLKSVDYGYDASDAILLERKDDMRRRGLASPDDGDALALTFAYPVAKRDWAEERRFEEGLQRLKRWVV